MKKSPLQYFLYLSIGAAIVTIVLKSYAYYVTGSVGLMSDALESFVNLFAAIFALLMLIISQKPADKKHMYGHSKAEYFSSAAEGALIIIAAFSIIRSAIPRIINPVSIENVDLGLLLSLIASLVNFGVGSVLIINGKKRKSLILEADGRHLMTDVWTSLGVIVGIIIVKFTGWYIVDPIIALFVAVNIMYTGYKLIKRSARGLMDATIPDEDMKQIIVYLDSLKSKQIEYHSLMTRVAGQRKFIFFHLLVPGNWTVKHGHDCADEIEEHIISMFTEPVTVDTHLEPVEDPASMNDIGIDRIH
ncbi:MAG: cation transporter [Fermentimonas sp.]|nr:cation transporter [Fermentimonas sp.]